MNVLPIIIREFHVLSRNRGVFVLRTLLVGFIFATWFISTEYTMDGPATLNLLSETAFFLFGIPAAMLAADTISSERRNQTLGLLRLTPLKPSGVVFGKLVSSSAQFVLCLIAIVPIFSLSLLQGGLDWIDVIIRTLRVFTLIFLALSIGLFFSTIFRQASSSILLSLITLAGYYFGFYREELQQWYQNTIGPTSQLTYLIDIGSAFGLGLIFFNLSWIAFRTIWRIESNPGNRTLPVRSLSNLQKTVLKRPLLRFKDHYNPLDRLADKSNSHLIRRLLVSLPTACFLILGVISIFSNKNAIFGTAVIGFMWLIHLELFLRLLASVEASGPAHAMRAAGWLDLLLIAPKNKRLLSGNVFSTLNRLRNHPLKALFLCHALQALILTNLYFTFRENGELIITWILVIHFGNCFLLWLELHSLRILGVWLGLRWNNRIVTSGIAISYFCLFPIVVTYLCIVMYLITSHNINWATEIWNIIFVEWGLEIWIIIFFVVRLFWVVFGYRMAATRLSALRKTISF